MRKYTEQGLIAILYVKTQNLHLIRWMFFQNIKFSRFKAFFIV